jgi:uncharacterized OB-fold protein
MRPLRPADVAPDDLDAPFWDACREHRFLIHRCQICAVAYWPASCCVDHGVQDMRWEDASGRGVVHTFTVVHHAYEPSMVARIPYALAVVRLEEGPFFHSDIVDCDPVEVHVDMPVIVRFEPIDDDDGAVLPHFAPDPSRTASPRRIV